jgi:hypothetical protein
LGFLNFLGHGLLGGGFVRRLGRLESSLAVGLRRDKILVLQLRQQLARTNMASPFHIEFVHGGIDLGN